MSIKQYTRRHPRRITAVISVLGYAIVIAAFAGRIPVPEIGTETVQLLSDLIALINTAALLLLLAGWRFIKEGKIRHHRAAMLAAFTLIMVFLFVYVWKISGGFEKAFVIQQGQFLAEYATYITYFYWTLLIIHILLSVVSVPVVLHAVILGLTHSPAELGDTIHPRVGKMAVGAWTISLGLGLITYFMLNHVYSWEKVRLGGILLVLVRPRLEDIDM